MDITLAKSLSSSAWKKQPRFLASKTNSSHMESLFDSVVKFPNIYKQYLYKHINEQK